MTGRLEGKVALITGAARGMGAAHARAFVAEGAAVTIADIEEAAGTALAAELGDRARFARLDVGDETTWSQVVAGTVDAFGGLDVLVNNAGILQFAPIEAMSVETWERVLRINLTGTFLGIKASVPALSASPGASIINIASVAGRKGIAGVAPYVASKHAIIGLTKTAALELADRGIRVNAVLPGNVATEMLAGITEFPLVAMHRAGQADEVSRLVVYLASDDSSFSTGGEFLVDGGELAGTANPPA